MRREGAKHEWGFGVLSRWNVSNFEIYFTYPSEKEPIENIWRAEAHSKINLQSDFCESKVSHIFDCQLFKA